MEANVFLGTFNAAEMFWYPSPDLCLDTILFLKAHGLVFAQVCARLYQLNLPQVDSNQVVETSQG